MEQIKYITLNGTQYEISDTTARNKASSLDSNITELDNKKINISDLGNIEDNTFYLFKD
jgi:hypothetical protein